MAYISLAGNHKSALLHEMMKCHIYMQAQLFLFSFAISVGMEEHLNLREMVNFM